MIRPFTATLLDEVAPLFFNGEPHTAWLILRDLVKTSTGFEALGVATAKAAKGPG